MAQTTQKALAASLKKLLEKTTLGKITVKEIVEECGVNRQTFYYHFQDISALLEWIYSTETTEAIANNKTYATWQQGFLETFRYIKQNQAWVVNSYHSLSREHLERYLYNVVYKLMIDVVNEQAQGMHVSEKDKTFIANFYKYAFVGLMLEWIRTGMKEQPEDIVDQLSKLITGDILKALHNFEQ